MKFQNNSQKIWVAAATTATTIAGILAFYFNHPTPFCQLGINILNSCPTPTPTQEIQLVVRGENQEPLKRVEILFIGKNAPEKVFTDDNGYVKVKIASSGDITVILSKEGYGTQTVALNLDDPNKVKIIDLKKDGQPKVITSSEIPPPAVVAINPSTTPTPPPSTTPPPNATDTIQTVVDNNVTWELKSCVREVKNVRCTFSTSISQDGRYGQFLPIFVDIDGNEYRASLVKVANYSFSSAWYIDMVINAHYKVTIDFRDVPTSVNKIISLKASGNYYSNGITFRDIPIN